MTNKKDLTYSEEQDAVLDLTSDLYLLDERDKQYLSRYYRSLVQDLYHVVFDTKEVMDIAYQILKRGKEVALDLEALSKQKTDYVLKTIAHMVTLLDFAMYYSKPVREQEGEESQREKVYELTGQFFAQFEEEFWEDYLYEYFVLDIEEIVPACHKQFEDNITNTIRSVRTDYPDFLNKTMLDEYLHMISDDVERVCSVMHELTPFDLLVNCKTGIRRVSEKAKGLKWKYEKLMEQEAQELYELGVQHYFGEDGIKMNKGTALAYFAIAGSQGHVLAMVNMGLMFLNGEGVEVNYAESLYWFIQAAKEGNERGMYFIADFYMTGRGVVEENHSIAAKFYTVSAAHSSVAALYNIGVLKLYGDGVKANEEEALLFIRHAAAKGYEPAVQALKKE